MIFIECVINLKNLNVNALDCHWMNLFLFKYSIVYPGWKPGSVWLCSKLFNCNLKSVPCDGWVSIEMWSTRERCVGVVGGAAANIFSIIFKTIFFFVAVCRSLRCLFFRCCGMEILRCSGTKIFFRKRTKVRHDLLAILLFVSPVS